MEYFLAKNDKQLGICLRMLYANGLKGVPDVVVNDKGKVEFHVHAAAVDKELFDELNRCYEILIS